MTPTGHSPRVAFLQQRLSRFGLAAAGLFLSALGVRLVISAAIGEWTFSALDLGGLVGAAALLTLVWLTLRRGSYSERTLRGADLVAMNCVTIALVVMVLGIPPNAHPETVLLLSMIVTFGMRVTYVPSTATQTLVVQGTATSWLIVAILEIQSRHAAVSPDDSYTSMRAILLNTFVWWAFSVSINAGASRVIFGLRQKIREAEQLGQYTLETKLGEGGMGAVYRASHALLRRPTAIKLLPPSRRDDTSVERFEKEVQRTAALTHPNIVTVFDYGRTPDGIFYYAMEFLDGLDLDELVRRFGPQPPARVAHLLRQICDGLAAAHEVDLIHRDVKPANVFALRGGPSADLVKIVDFGLVKEAGEEADAGPSEDVITGTPHYLSPEAIQTPGAIDARSDLYAVGAVGYFLLTGTHVFDADTLVELLAQHLDARPVPPSERLGAPVPEGLEELVLRCLEKDPAIRPADAVTLRALLDSLEDVALWRTEDAARWWTEAGEQGGSMELPTQVGSDTVAVDLRARRRAASQR